MNVLALGSYDLLHVGHVRLFQRAFEFGPLTVGVNTDEFIERYKGRAPIIGLADRLEMVAAVRYVDRVAVNEGEEDSRPIIAQYAPCVLVAGDDWAGRDVYHRQLGVSEAWLADNGVVVVILTRTPGVSSSEIRETLCV